MPAHFIVSVNVESDSDRESYDRYIDLVRPIVERHGGRYLVRSEKIAHLGGRWRPDRVIVIEFPTTEHIRTCFSSPEYREIEKLRSDSVDSSGIIVQG